MFATDIYDLVHESYELLKNVFLHPIPATGFLGQEFNLIWISYRIQYHIWKSNQFRLGFFNYKNC